MIDISKPNPLRFIDDMKEEFDAGAVIKATDLYGRYRCWCFTNGERNVCTARKFGLVIKCSDTIKKTKKADGMYYSA